MQIFHDPATRARRSTTELAGGQLIAPWECPERVARIHAALSAAGHGAFTVPADAGLAPVRAIHAADYLDFLAGAWDAWQAAGYTGEAIATAWPTRNLRADRPPRQIDGRLGHYALTGETAIESGTWQAARASANIAVATVDHHLAHALPAFGLCRPPGHHAAADQFGGYCFLNNAAIAAQRALDGGHRRVAILDIDYHHGNGTQAIFYERADVVYASIHADPMDEFPYFLGHADERGHGSGLGANHNYPLAAGSGYARWRDALDSALARLRAAEPSLLIVSLGVDAHAADPISSFTLDTADFHDAGHRIGQSGLPTIFLMEGGYAVECIGDNVGAVLAGFEQACVDR